MTPTEIVNEFIARLCRFDVDGACELVTEDVEYDNVPMGKNHGPQGIKDLLGPMVSGLDEVDWVIHREAATGDVVMNERTDRFRSGENWIELPVTGVFELRDGKIALWRDYFDLETFNQQMAAALG